MNREDLVEIALESMSDPDAANGNLLMAGCEAANYVHPDEAAREAIEQALKAIEDAGFAIVPVEPTEAMIEAGVEGLRNFVVWGEPLGGLEEVARDVFEPMAKAMIAEAAGPTPLIRSDEYE